MSFGYHLESRIFERCSDVIRYIMKQHGHNALMNYVDGLIYIGLPSKIHQSYQFLQDLGLQVSQSKLIPPHTQVTCLGIVVNTKILQEIHNIWTSPPVLKGNYNLC